MQQGINIFNGPIDSCTKPLYWIADTDIKEQMNVKLLISHTQSHILTGDGCVNGDCRSKVKYAHGPPAERIYDQKVANHARDANGEDNRANGVVGVVRYVNCGEGPHHCHLQDERKPWLEVDISFDFIGSCADMRTMMVPLNLLNKQLRKMILVSNIFIPSLPFPLSMCSCFSSHQNLFYLVLGETAPSLLPWQWLKLLHCQMNYETWCCSGCWLKPVIH